MALFFVGFAPGIWLWGWLADRLGRRPALLGGLGLAALATFGAWASTDLFLPACLSPGPGPRPGDLLGDGAASPAMCCKARR